MRRRPLALLLLALLAPLSCARARQPPPPAERPRVVAVGDLHGDLDAALGVLAMAGLVDGQGAWIGGDAILVQTGDTTDRGPRSLGVMELMRRLEGEAAAAGGAVHALLGNHEAMNLRGDWRYVSEEDVAEFGGLEARKAAFAAEAPIGAWLREADTAVIVEGVVFVHGGIRPQWAALGAPGISKAVQEALAGRASPEILGDEGPLWYRGYALAPEPVACAELTEALTALAARRMVVGHSTRKDGRIASRCGGQLLLIDTGISAHYGGNTAALEIRQNDAKALYPEGAVDLPDP
jgi:hypothetical protein